MPDTGDLSAGAVAAGPYRANPYGAVHRQHGKNSPVRGSWACYGFWKPAPWRIFCASGLSSHFTNAAAAAECFESLTVAAG